MTDFDEVWGIMNDDIPKLWDEIHRLQKYVTEAK